MNRLEPRNCFTLVQTLAILLMTCQLWAQTSAPSDTAAQTTQSQAAASTQPTEQQPPPATSDELEQMRTDLDRMESLLGNMSAEIEFLRDQNLQILLRTNAQMWRVLIRDLRRQVDREQRQRNPR